MSHTTCMALLRSRSFMRANKIQSTVFIASSGTDSVDLKQLPLATFCYIKANTISIIKKKIIISNLFRGSQSSRNDSSGNNEDEKHFVPHRDAAA